MHRNHGIANIVSARALVGLAAWGLTLGGCDLLSPKEQGGAADARVYPDAPYDPNTGECATNWLPRTPADLGSRVKVENERLVITSDGPEVVVEGLLGVAPGGRGAVLRFDFHELDLGTDGRFDIEMVAPEGTVARLVVQPAGAVLMVEAIPYGSNAEIRFAHPPERMVFEFDMHADGGASARAFFFDAARAKVLTTGVPRFSGGLVTNVLTLSGKSSVAKLERFARIDPGNGGLMEDFWCDSVGLASDRSRFPEGRASKAGNPCGDDDQCGAGELCVDNYCRRACLASSQCLTTVCIVLEDGGLCSVPGEQCEPTPGLVCGGDGALRIGCRAAGDCPRPEDLCIGGACVSNDEAVTRDGAAWGECPYATERCEGDRVEACDTDGPGWNLIEECAEGQCAAGEGAAFCDACVRSCGGQLGEDVLASCDGGAPRLDKDCKDGFEVCSLGDTGSEPAHCRPVIQGAPAATPVEVGTPTTWYIDATEVTRAQYAAFLQSAPSPVTQIADCGWNVDLRPPDWPWFDAPERAVQVDFCDAQAYCESVGRSLCSADQWYQTCSVGGQLDFPYGDSFQTGVCSIDPRRDVGTNPECSADSGSYDGVLDLIGGVGEWIDGCALGSTSVRAADSCKTRGTSASQTCEVERTVRRDSIAGIRCCAP